MSLSLASIHIHPVKSLGGFAVEKAKMTDRGLAHDRRWMLVDDAGRFLTQREVPTMACLHTQGHEHGFMVTDTRSGEVLHLPWHLREGPATKAVVWSDEVHVLHGSEAWDAWFTERLLRAVRVVFMPDATQRLIDERFAKGLTSLSDDYPYLIISQVSLDDLNHRGASGTDQFDGPWTHVPMDRFRPNLVIAGGAPFQEDTWRRIRIGAVHFDLVKPCARCVITTTDQLTGARGSEPLRTLATYRKADNKVLFGMNAVGDVEGELAVGDAVVPVA